MASKALITGVTGQDGSYLAELLLSRGYEVHGLIRKASTFNTDRIDDLFIDPHDPEARFFLHYGDLADRTPLIPLLYHLPPPQPLRRRQSLRLLDGCELPSRLRDVRLQRHHVQPRVATPR